MGLTLEAALRAMPLAVVVADGDLRDIRASDAGARLLGLPPGENLAAGRKAAPWTVSRNGQPLSPVQFPLSRALRGEEVVDQEIDLAFPDGRRLTLLASARPIRDGQGRIAGAACTLRDRAENDRLAWELGLNRRQAEEAGILKDWRLAIAFHDIRSFLNTVNLLAEILGGLAAKPESQGEEIVRLAGDMKTTTASLIKVVLSTLDLARSTADRPTLEESEFSVAELIEEECRHHRALAQEKGLRLVVERPDPPDPPLWIRTDRSRLAHALGFLVRYALQRTTAGSVTARAAMGAGQRPQIEVIDTGGGLPPEIERQLLDHLSRIRREGAAEGDPGLVVARKLAEALDAKLSIENRTGVGATYRITLAAEGKVLAPASPAAAPGSSEPAASLPTPGTASLLFWWV